MVGAIERDIVVNDSYLNLLYNKSFYLILRGSAGSGKSVFASQKAFIRLYTTPRLRGYGVRKVGVDIEGSVFKEFKERIYENGSEDDWTINNTKHSFYCKRNGSEFVTFHMEDEKRTKSIVKADFIWVEEMDQLTFDDWDQLGLRLRGKPVDYMQIVGSFNPTDEKSWIRPRFFPEEKETEKIFNLDLSELDPKTGDLIEIKATVCQFDFNDNEYLSPQDRARYELYKYTNPRKYEIYVLNKWGKSDVGSPWLFNFNRTFITKEKLFKEDKPLIFSFDFNYDPMMVTVHQMWFDRGHHWRIIDEISMSKGSVPGIIKKIQEKYPSRYLSNCYVTGDATAEKNDINQIDNRSSWKLIKSLLKISDNRFHVPLSNPRVSDNRELCNYIFYAHKDILISENCKIFIYEAENTEADVDSGIPKKNRSKLEQRADALDTVRYVINRYLYDFIDKPSKYR